MAEAKELIYLSAECSETVRSEIDLHKDHQAVIKKYYLLRTARLVINSLDM